MLILGLAGSGPWDLGSEVWDLRFERTVSLILDGVSGAAVGYGYGYGCRRMDAVNSALRLSGRWVWFLQLLRGRYPIKLSVWVFG